MSFQTELKKYIDLLNISPKELSDISGLSPTIISRYLNGKRTPRINSDYFNQIIISLNQIASSKNIDLTEDIISQTLKNSITSSTINYDIFVNNFNILLVELKTNIGDIAKYTGYDASFISRIKNNTRKPGDPQNFVDSICNFFINAYQEKAEKLHIASILNCNIDDLKEMENYKNTIYNWLTTENKNNNQSIRNFLTKLDCFDLNDYVTKIDYSKVKIITSPVIIKTSKIYYGKTGRKQSESDFLKTTLISKSKEPIYFYNDLPMTEPGSDEEFKQKWALAITMILKKGLHLNIIHNVDRPINEMLLGLESWLPVYMTGSISPYYFVNPPSNIFLGSYCSSGSVALFGECNPVNAEISRFYLTTKKDEVKYFNERNKYMLSKAKPLMDIFKEEHEQEFENFLKEQNVYFLKDFCEESSCKCEMDMASINKNSNISLIKKDSFKNINFVINENKWIMINKELSPKIHFVIYNNKLINAIKSFLQD